MNCYDNLNLETTWCLQNVPLSFIVSDNRLRNVMIRAGQHPHDREKNRLCGIVGDVVPKSGSASLNCSYPILARYVSADLSVRNTFLPLCEFQVTATSSNCTRKC